MADADRTPWIDSDEPITWRDLLTAGQVDELEAAGKRQLQDQRAQAHTAIDLMLDQELAGQAEQWAKLRRRLRIDAPH